MHFSKSLALASFVAYASAHGVVTEVQGANGVNMPGLSIADGTPRDCSSNRCGSQADTSIIRDGEMNSGRATPLGRTQGNGPVNAETMMNMFMGDAAAPAAKRSWFSRRQLLGGLLGGNRGNAGGATAQSSPATEARVAAMAGSGASSGLPTASDDGTVTMSFRQINQDGAGPMTADIDATSGGTDANAFQSAKVTQDVPGIGVQGLSLATVEDFPLKVQMPQGMTCEGTVGAASNVCIVRVRNGAAAGPFGGSAAFTQSPAARKRALEYRKKKRATEFAA